MATTTPNFGWAVPTSTDLVKDGAVAIETLGDSIDASLVDLKGGTTGQVLAKASGTDMDFTWTAVDPLVILDAKGDLITATAADTPARLAVGTNGQVLTADSTASTGIKWATPASGGSTFVGALVTKSASQSISNATAANVTWNLETFDTNGFHDNSTNNTRMTIPTGYGGKYAWSTTIGWGIASESGNKTIDIRKNNATIFYNEYEPAAEVDFINLSGIIDLVATDYLEVRVRQTSGGAVNVHGDDYNATTVSFFSITYLGA